MLRCMYTAVHMHVAASLAALLQSNCCIKLSYTVYILHTGYNTHGPKSTYNSLRIRHHGSEFFLGMSPIQNCGPNPLYLGELAKLAKRWQRGTIKGHG